MSHPRRNFNPKKSPRYGAPTFTPSVLVKYSPKWKYRRLFSFPFSGSHFRPRMRTLVLSIDGGCRINNRQDANSRAAYAVYFGPGSADNHAATLAYEEPHTSNRAELHAAIAALEIVERKRDGGKLELVREVILMTDSEYVARSMDSWIWNWERNGWRKKKGGAVENRDLMGVLQGMMERLEMSGMRVLFWRVEREWNVEADEMVNAVLDEAE